MNSFSPKLLLPLGALSSHSFSPLKDLSGLPNLSPLPNGFLPFDANGFSSDLPKGFAPLGPFANGLSSEDFPKGFAPLGPLSNEFDDFENLRFAELSAAEPSTEPSPAE